MARPRGRRRPARADPGRPYNRAAAAHLSPGCRRASPMRTTAAGRPAPASTSRPPGSARSTRWPRRIVRENPFAAGVDPEFGELDETEAAALMEQALDEAMEGSLTHQGFLDLVTDAPSLGGVRDATRHVHERLRAAGHEVPRLVVTDAPGPTEAQRQELAEAVARGVGAPPGAPGPPRAARAGGRAPPVRRGRPGGAEAVAELRPRLQAARRARQRRRERPLAGAPRPRGAGAAAGVRGQPRGLRRALRGAQARARRPRLRGPAARRAARPAGRPRLPVRPRLRRRVPGRERAPGRDRRPAGGRADGRGRRRLPGDLRLPPRGRRALHPARREPAGRDPARQPPQPGAAAARPQRALLGAALSDEPAFAPLTPAARGTARARRSRPSPDRGHRRRLGGRRRRRRASRRPRRSPRSSAEPRASAGTRGRRSPCCSAP